MIEWKGDEWQQDAWAGRFHLVVTRDAYNTGDEFSGTIYFSGCNEQLKWIYERATMEGAKLELVDWVEAVRAELNGAFS